MEQFVSDNSLTSTTSLVSDISMDAAMRTVFAKGRANRTAPRTGTAKYGRFAINFLRKVEGQQAVLRAQESSKGDGDSSLQLQDKRLLLSAV